MAYRFDFDRSNVAFRVSFDGEIDDAEMRKYDTNVRHLLAKIHPRGAIVDASKVTKFDVSSALIRSIAVSEAEMADPAVPIVIVAPPAHVYGMARMFQILSDEKRPNLAVVRSADEAYAKLGLTSLHFEPLPETEV